MFTKKDFLLLEDAINDGIERFYSLRGIRENHYKLTDVGAENNLRHCLATAMAEKLKYTSDGFDAEKFKRSITQHDLETKKIKDKPLDTVTKVE